MAVRPFLESMNFGMYAIGPGRYRAFKATRSSIEFGLASLRTRAFKLEDTSAIAPSKHFEGCGVLLVDLLYGESGVVLLDKVLCMLDQCEGLESEKIHFHQTTVFQHIHGVLGGDGSGFRVSVEGDIVGEDTLADDDARRMGGRMAVEALEPFGHVEQLGVNAAPLLEFPQLRGKVYGPLDREFPRFTGGFIIGQRLGDQSHNAGGFGKGNVQYPCDILEYGLDLQGTESSDLGDPVRSVFCRDVVDDLLPALIAEVDIEVGHGDPFRIQEPLEYQVVLDRVDIGDGHAIGDQGTGPGTASGSYGNPVLFCPEDEVPHNEEIPCESHADNDIQFVVKPFLQFFGNLWIPFCQTFLGDMPEILVGIFEFRWYFICRQHRSRLVYGEVAPLGDPNGILDCLGNPIEESGHGVRALHIEFHRIETHAVLVVLLLVRSYTKDNIVRIGIGIFDIVDIIGRHDGQPEFPGQFDDLWIDLLLFRQTMVLQFQIVPVVVENRGVEQCALLCSLVIVVGQQLGDLSGETRREADESFVMFGQQLVADPGFVIIAFRVGDRIEYHEVLVALFIHGYQDQMVVAATTHGGRLCRMGFGVHIEFTPYNRVYPLCFASFVELEDTEHVSMVGNGQVLHPILFRFRDITVDRCCSIKKRIIGVVVQMDKFGHARLLGRPYCSTRSDEFEAYRSERLCAFNSCMADSTNLRARSNCMAGISCSFDENTPSMMDRTTRSICWVESGSIVPCIIMSISWGMRNMVVGKVRHMRNRLITAWL